MVKRVLQILIKICICFNYLIDELFNFIKIRRIPHLEKITPYLTTTLYPNKLHLNFKTNNNHLNLYSAYPEENKANFSNYWLILIFRIINP